MGEWRWGRGIVMMIKGKGRRSWIFWSQAHQLLSHYARVPWGLDSCFDACGKWKNVEKNRSYMVGRFGFPPQAHQYAKHMNSNANPPARVRNSLISSCLDPSMEVWPFRSGINTPQSRPKETYREKKAIELGNESRTNETFEP